MHRLPAFVVKVEHWVGTEPKRGTGLLINPWQVVTCRHVVDAIIGRRLSAISEVSPLGEVVTVLGGGTEARWECAATPRTEWSDPKLDLAVLQLATPAPVNHFPHFVRNLTRDALNKYFRHGDLCGYRCDTGEAGLLHWAGDDIAVSNEGLADGVSKVSVLQINGRGAQSGFSGGGALVRAGERTYCIGLARFGGDAASFTKLTGSDEVLRALADRVVRKPEGITQLNDAQLGFAVVDLAVPRDFDPAIQVYLAQLHQRHTTLDWTGLGSKHGIRARVDVEALYQERFALRCPAGHEDRRGLDIDALDYQRDRLPLVEALGAASRSRRRGFVLLGHPGMGKTTYLKSLLLAVLREGSESVGLAPGLLPVFIPLEELSHAVEGGPPPARARSKRRQLQSASFTDLAIQYLERAHGVSADFCRSMLDVLVSSAGGAAADCPRLFLLDGLDQVADQLQRAQVVQWIGEQCERLPTSVFVVTCRTAGYRELGRAANGNPGQLPPQHFLELDLQPLGPKQGQQFVERWYESVASDDPPSGEANPAAWAALRAADLWETLSSGDFRTTRLAELAGNPLLLTATCVVHRRNRELPKERGALYEACVDVLTESWRHLSRLQPLGAGDIKRLLQAVAHWMHQQPGRQRSNESELAAMLQPRLVALGSKLSGSEFLQVINNDSGLLTGYSKDSYGFLHLAFQEYLCAKELMQPAFALGSWWPGSAAKAEKKRVATLASHCGDAWWQEVAALVAVAGNSEQFTTLMDALLANPKLPEGETTTWLGQLDRGPGWTREPFVRLLGRSPGTDRWLWERQLVALQFLLQWDKPSLVPLLRLLRKHPFERIRELVRPVAGELISSEAGSYELIWIEGGTFNMGSLQSEEGRFPDEGPAHDVTVSGFYLGRHPVTNAQYGRFLGANPFVDPPAYWSDRARNQPAQPVIGVSWRDAKRCAEWMGLRLPTEAEWEYACRAGTKTRFWSGDRDVDLERVGWVASNSGVAPYPVARKPANSWGLYDMHGNVDEWCFDGHRQYQEGREVNPLCVEGRTRAVRGGSWHVSATFARSAYRYFALPDLRNSMIGFRLARGH